MVGGGKKTQRSHKKSGSSRKSHGSHYSAQLQVEIKSQDSKLAKSSNGKQQIKTPSKPDFEAETQKTQTTTATTTVDKNRKSKTIPQTSNGLPLVPLYIIQKTITNNETANCTNVIKDSGVHGIQQESEQQSEQQYQLYDDDVTDDEDIETIEYIYKPRKYFVIALCNLCKEDLCLAESIISCTKCHLVYYCQNEHLRDDVEHRSLCKAAQQIARTYGDHLFYKCDAFTPEEFRSYRIVTIRKIENILKRQLTTVEREMILFPRICCQTTCREYRFDCLKVCKDCGMIAFCSKDHIPKSHHLDCEAYQLFKNFIIRQEKYGEIVQPTLPTKVMNCWPFDCSNTKQIFEKLHLGKIINDDCEFAALTQISTAPLTVWYTMKLCKQLQLQEELTVHLIGAESDFEAAVLQKWELFLLHLSPEIKRLNIVFIGPELNSCYQSFKTSNIKCCKECWRKQRSVGYYFVEKIYDIYRQTSAFIKPHLICFFNAGLYRCTGYNMTDTWPATISAATELNVPIVVTAYTAYEMPLDLKQLLYESRRNLNIVLPPHQNPFASCKPERNFISDDDTPLIYKNYYCFIVE